jgi:hypothetical protein
MEGSMTNRVDTIPRVVIELLQLHQRRPSDAETDRDAAVLATLRWGGWDHIAWLFAAYGRAAIRDAVERDAASAHTLPEHLSRLWTVLLEPDSAGSGRGGHREGSTSSGTKNRLYP